MKLITEVLIQKQLKPITYESKLLCLGSCFAEHIGKKLEYYKFQVTGNPFGILFHPQAILNVIEKAVNEEEFTSKDVFLAHEKWHSFFAHSRLSRNSSAEILAVLNSAEKELRDAILGSSHILITLGTSFVYEHLATKLLVANCHKVPQSEFKKQLTLVNELEIMLSRIIKLCRELNPKTKFIFTVSPVRHIKEGIVENQRSKAQLITALHNVLEGESNVTYFPSYELMMDELRDYRFYNRDLIHPSDLAVDLIWKRFKACAIDEGLYADMDKVDKLQKSLAHRPSATKGETFEKLKAYQYKLKKELKEKYPFMSL